ncbi:hypothetical protein CIC12_16900 [Burkholderia sp. SG-MS1]|nr:hypothetical protein [Paraburkholderia sp. SG-MS1]
MPVDLSAVGLSSTYPTNKPRLVRWLIIWGLCCGIGAPVALLLWPVGEPARGAWFWLCVAGAPNGLFLLLLGIARAGYDAFYVQALYRNRHRQAWLHRRVSYAQRPLQILGAAYCLPLGGKGLAEVIIAGTPQVKAQALRRGSGRLMHGRFSDDDPLPKFDVSNEKYTGVRADDAVIDDTGQDNAPKLWSSTKEVSPYVAMFAQTLDPLAGRLRALSQYGPTYAPAVRVLASADAAELRVRDVRHALGIAGLPALDCSAVPVTDGLLVADAWLDAGEHRPLLVIAAGWHDERNPPSAGSTEGSVAVLFGSGVLRLPEPVTVLGTLHRPVAYDFAGLSDILGNAVLWGNVDAQAIHTAWLSGLDATHDTALLAALAKASLTTVSKQDAQRRVDRIIGRAGAADGWLSIAAAVESGLVGPHLILHNAQRAQAAILYVNSPPSHDESDK